MTPIVQIVIDLVVTAVVTRPWLTFVGAVLLPLYVFAYVSVRRQRALRDGWLAASIHYANG